MNEKKRLVKKAMGLFLLGLMTVLLSNYSQAQPLVQEFVESGNFKIFAKGVGLLDDNRQNVDTGDITLDIPATASVARAFLSWQYLPTPGNNSISINNGSGKVQILGTLSTEDSLPTSCLFAEIDPNLILTGSTSYTISDLDDTKNHPGAGLLVVAEDPSFPFQKVEVQAGCDFFFFGEGGEENSEIITFDFDSSTETRDGKVTLFVGDAQTDIEGIRANDILYFPGSGTPPMSLVDGSGNPIAGSVSLGKDINGLVANDGTNWDTFGRNSGVIPPDPGFNSANDPDLRASVLVPAGADFASFQLISPPLLPPPVSRLE